MELGLRTSAAGSVLGLRWMLDQEKERGSHLNWCCCRSGGGGDAGGCGGGGWRREAGDELDYCGGNSCWKWRLSAWEEAVAEEEEDEGLVEVQAEEEQ